ncbi:MAG: hypothetical protein ACTSYM_11480 [Candidatus Baldrarchaeia archaeon]
MAVPHIVWRSIKSFLGWFLLTLVFILTAGFTSGFRAYCPLESLIYGSLAVYIIILIYILLFPGSE